MLHLSLLLHIRVLRALWHWHSILLAHHHSGLSHCMLSIGIYHSHVLHPRLVRVLSAGEDKQENVIS